MTDAKDVSTRALGSSALKVEGLRVSYDREPVVEDLSFEVLAGQLVGIVGPHGAGKSTMIKAVVGAIGADQGRVEVFGQPVKQALGRITYVPQRGAVDWDFPVTVWDVVCQGRYGKLGLLGRLKAKDREIVEQALAQVSMSDYRQRQIGELSGGQQQRVFLARALAQQGDVYLLDEPFVGVDARTEHAIIEVLRALRQDGKAVLVVHHDLSTAPEYFDQILLMNKQLIAYGPTASVFTQPNLQRAYGGRLAIFDGQDGAALAITGG